MLAFHTEDTRRLLQFNLQVLAQAAALIESRRADPAETYRRPIGAHLRHVIEHYEALLQPAVPNALTRVVDYDSRVRDRAVETQPMVALARVHALQQRLAMWTGPELHTPVIVRGMGGVAGDFTFSVSSSVARELVFAASHAVHHYALLRQHCEEIGQPLPAEFGRAPSTVAHDRQAHHSHEQPSPDQQPGRGQPNPQAN